MKLLVDGLKSGKSADKLLDVLPKEAKADLLRALADTPGSFQSINALIGQEEPEPTTNYLAR
jgi:hypothetical protein